LLDLGGQGVTVVWVAREGSGAHHQALVVGDRDAGLDTKLAGLANVKPIGAATGGGRA
jgi:hypothetical protein